MAKRNKPNKVNFENMVTKYQDGREDAPKSGDDASANYLWWKYKEDDEIAESVCQVIEFINDNTKPRVDQLNRSALLYGANLNYYGGTFLYPSSAQFSQVTTAPGKVGYNLCFSVVETVVSKLARNKIIPTFVTNGATWGMQKKAEQLTKFIGGIFYGQKIHEKGVQALRDGGVFGDGILHVYEAHDQVHVERVLPHEIFVDPLETINSAPRQMHRIKYVDRSILAEMFPDKEKIIEENDGIDFTNSSAVYKTVADLVAVTESWHLPSGPDATDGLHIICLGENVLFKEEYKKDFFPFVFMNYSKRMFGFWSQGAVERLTSLQYEINKIMMLMQRTYWLGGTFKILVPLGSKIVPQHFDNEVGTVIFHTPGNPPQYITPPLVQPELYTYKEKLIQEGYSQEGISMTDAAGTIPDGLDSGKALRVYNDIADDRQTYLAQGMEEFYLDVARLCIETVKDIYSRTKTYEAVFPDGKFLESVDWKDIQLDKDEYELKCYPTSSLSDDMAGRLQEVQELAAAGMISPRTARKLLRMPDLEMADNLATAPEDLLCKVIEDMLDGGDYRAPEPFMDLALAKTLCLQYYNYADYQNAPDDILEKLRMFSSQIDDLLGVNNPPPPPGSQPMVPPGAGPGGPVVPPANPTATPTSPMIPNVNMPGAA